jgi:retron-type reverse transcriptase
VNLIRQIGSEANLQKAWIKAQHFASNNAPFYDVTEYDEYSQYIKENFLIIRDELLSRSYKPTPFRQIAISKSNGEKRILFFASAKDNLVMMAILNVLAPEYEQLMYKGSYGNRLAYGEEEENKSIFKRWQESYKMYIKHARSFLSSPSTAYYYITDLRNFYPSIDKELLLEKIGARVDENTYHLLENIIYTESINNSEQLETISGVPTGTPLAPFLANIYLTELDYSMRDITIDYVRYVDDIIFSCEDSVAMNDTVCILASSLQELSLEQNIQKTTQEPIPIQEPGELLEHTRKMHYNQRFEMVRDISFEEQKEANQIFSEIFLAVEKEGDIRTIAGSSASLVVRFLERNELENLEKITLKLLETGIVKPETIWVVMGTQMRIAQKHGLNFRFRDFLLNGRDIEKLTFLKLLPQFKELSENDLVSEILQAWSKSNDYLIRSSIYDAGYQLDLAHYFPNLSVDFDNEHSEYVRSKILRCLGANILEEQQSSIQTILENEQAPLISLAIFWVIYASWSNDPDMQDRYTATLLLISRQSITEITAWCQRFLLEQNRPEWWQIYERIPLEIRNLLLECTLSQIEVDQGSNLIVSSIESASGDGLSFDVSGILPTESISDYIKKHSQQHVAIPQFGYECSRKDYGHLSDRPDYVCQIIECPDGRRATIEYVHINRILSNENEFPTVDHWWHYLDRLQDKGIITILDRGEYSETVVYCVYEIPHELQTLYDVIRNQGQNRDRVDPYRITNSIVQAMKITEEEGFRFDGIVPQNIILPSSNAPCKLVNIGFGLRPPNHNCTQPSCRHYQRRSELGRTTGLHFIGLSILELLLNTCPMEELQKIKSETEPETTLANLLGKIDLDPHMRSLLGRLLQDEVTWRYQSISILQKDLQHIADYRISLSYLPEDYHDHFTLVDYILFRFAVALRTPRVADSESSTLEKTVYIVRDISRHIKYLDEKYKRIFRNAVAHMSVWQMRRLGIPLRSISPESRYLLRVSNAWVGLIDNIRQQVAIPIYPLDRLLIYYAIYSELSTYAHAAAYKNRWIDKLEDLSWTGDLDSTINRVAFRLGERGVYARTVYSVHSLKETLQITRYVEDGSQSLLNPVTTINSLTAFLILNALGSSSQTSNVQSGLEIQTKLEFDFEVFTSIVNKAGNIEEVITACLSNLDNSTNALLNRSDWEDISDFLKALPQIMPIKRASGMLLDYDALLEQGVVRKRKWLILNGKLSFQAPQVLLRGIMTKAVKKQRHVRLDLVKVSGRHHLASVLSRPNLFPDALPLNNSKIARILQLVRKHPNLTRAVLYLLVVIILIISETAVLRGFAIILPAIWEPLYGLIDTILFPEESKDV